MSHRYATVGIGRQADIRIHSRTKRTKREFISVCLVPIGGPRIVLRSDFGGPTRPLFRRCQLIGACMVMSILVARGLGSGISAPERLISLKDVCTSRRSRTKRGRRA